MSFADDYAVTSSGRLFHYGQDAVGSRFSELQRSVRESIAAMSDDDCLAAEPDVWANEIAEELAVIPPRVDTAARAFTEEGRVEVNCANWPGISYNLNELGQGRVMRPGHRFLVRIPGEGELALLRTRLQHGGTGRRADLESWCILREYEWPQVRTADELQADVDAFIGDLEAGVEEVASEIAKRNTQLAPFAAKALAERQEEIRQSRAYLGDLRLTVTRDPAADTRIPALPIRRPGPGPSATTTKAPKAPSAPQQTAKPALDRPTLDEFYDHVVTVLGYVALGFERSPRRFTKANEEALRDFILVTLNSHYEGAATGEAFNGTGKTDILVRHGMDNAFIGECKFWSGENKLVETLEQLLGYTTWQDNRLALIFFVRNKNMHPVLDTTRDWVGARPEFGGWEGGAPDGQLRCRLRWGDAARKEGRLTIFLVHVPPA
jgi:hypothetical protein